MAAQRWKIEQLRAVVEAALNAADVHGPESKRVRAVPDTRTIRYYTTLGLLDRPAEMQGRTALYQRRHALQLVCIKRLQASGLSLAEVQQRLAGASQQQLQATAKVPKSFWENCEPVAERAAGSQESMESDDTTKSTREKQFWATPPSDVTPAVVAPPQARVRVPLGADVVLEIPGDAKAVTDALPELRPLIESLLDKLKELGLA